ncbi:hypothetical protein HanIR_Chr12g0603071 [Helianthus annuus]|nr:hypothetical protein HanIR_Chr12g0603071 [Helianthus annuus]
MTPRIVGKNSKPPELEVSPEPGFIGGARKPQLSFAPFISVYFFFVHYYLFTFFSFAAPPFSCLIL